MKNSRIGTLVLMAASCIVAMSALAGSKLNGRVIIDDAKRLAYGPLGGARNSADSAQAIAITVSSRPDGTRNLSVIFTNSAGLSRACTTSDPLLIEVADKTQGDSSIQALWNASGTCTYISVSQSSFQPPKVL
jgi:spore coat protein U-like protein